MIRFGMPWQPRNYSINARMIGLMEILPSSQRLKLLEYTTRLKFELAEWLIVELKLRDVIPESLTSSLVTEILGNLFKDKEGLVLACNTTEVLMLIKWGQGGVLQSLVNLIRKQLPSETCEAKVTAPTKEGLQKLILTITSPKAEDGTYYSDRIARQNNIILICDDDMYIRSLVKAGLKNVATIIEIGEGAQIIDAYKTHNPDIVLLDIHMPNLNGQEALAQIRVFDPRAYIIMLSADSSAENVVWSQRHGAKGFLAKPINKSKLSEYVEMCPTIKRS